MEIRKAKEEEIKKLCQIEMSSGYHKKKFDFEPYLHELFNDNVEIFCMEDKKSLVGYITLSKQGEIGFFAVPKKSQGRGIANLLLQKVISYAKNKNIKKLFLDVRRDNFPAIMLYLKNKFIITALYKKKIQSGELFKITMERRL